MTPKNTPTPIKWGNVIAYLLLGFIAGAFVVGLACHWFHLGSPRTGSLWGGGGGVLAAGLFGITRRFQ